MTNELNALYETAINGNWNEAYNDFKALDNKHGDVINLILDDDTLDQPFKLRLFSAFLYRAKP